MALYISLLLVSCFFILADYVTLVRGSAEVRTHRYNSLENSTTLVTSRSTGLPSLQPSTLQKSPGAFRATDTHLESSDSVPSLQSAGIVLPGPNSFLTSEHKPNATKLSRVGSSKVTPTGYYGTGRPKPYSPSLNVTKGQPHTTGFPLPEGNQDALYSDCYGTYTVALYSVETVTIIITEIVGTTTIAFGSPTPNATYIDPLPFCTTVDPCGLGACDYETANIPVLLPVTTVLVTKKTPAVSFTPSAVGPIFEASITPAPAQHFPKQLPDPGAQRTVPPVISTMSDQADSGGRPANPVVISPQGNIGQLPGPVPNPHDLGESSDTSNQGGSTPQHSGGVSGNRPGAIDGGQGSSAQGQGANSNDNAHGGQEPDSTVGSTDGDNGSGASSNPDGASGSNADGGGGSLPGEGNRPAVIIDPGTRTINNVPVSIGPGGVVVGSHHIAPGSGPTTVVVGDQTFTVEPTQIAAGGTTLSFRIATKQPFRAMTVGSVPVVLHPNDAVIGSRTYTPSPSPTGIVQNGHTYLLGISKLVAAETTVDLPHATSPLAMVTAGGEVFSVYPSRLEASGITIAMPSSPLPSQFTHRGETFTINPSELIVPDRTVALPSQAFSTITEGALAVTVNPSEAFMRDHTYLLTSGAKPTTTIINGQTITIGPNGVAFVGTTVALPRPTPAPQIVVADGLTFTVGSTDVILSGTKYAIGQGATPTTTIVSGETLSFGPGGVGLPGTTISLPASLVTADGLTFSLKATDVVISSTTYGIGSGAKPTTITVAGEAIGIGPGGIGLSNTTIVLPTAATSLGAGASVTLSPATPSISGESNLAENDVISAGTSSISSSDRLLSLLVLSLLVWAILV